MTISACFRRLIDQIQPTEREIVAAEGHLTTIQTRLRQSFTARRFFATGSHARKTYISGISDVDLFCVFSRDEMRWGDNVISSETALNRLRVDLERRFRFTPIRRDAQAIVLQFSDGCVDVVPAFFLRLENLRPVYAMPDGLGGWMETAPALHQQFLRTATQRSLGKQKCAARLLKYWRYCRSPAVPISSFHIEMALAVNETCRGIKSYAQCVHEALQDLAKRECRGLIDPLGVTGRIRCVKSAAQRETTLRSVRYSRDHAASALIAENDGDFEEAHRQWNIVFNGEFPRA